MQPNVTTAPIRTPPPTGVASETRALTELQSVLAEIEDALRPATTLSARELSQLAEAVFLIGARFGLGWAEAPSAP